MKFTAHAWLALCILLSAGQIQAQKVLVPVKQGKVERVMALITKQTNIPVYYHDEPLKDARPVTIKGDSVTVSQALQLCTRDQYFTAIYENGQIDIWRKLVTVRLKIVSEQGEPVNAVQVTVVDSGSIKKRTTTSDANGQFVLDTVYANAKLFLTSVNIEPVLIGLEGKTNFTIPVKYKIIEYNEAQVLATGYSKINKRDGTFSINYIDKYTINQRVSNSALDQLVGTAPGVTVVTNPTPGTYQAKEVVIGPRTTLYNLPDPLIVVDNFPYDNNALFSQLNPDDIESISILKDATAASIWGARAGNGVIVVTTRQAKYNHKLNCSFNTWVTTFNKPDLFYDKVMNAQDQVAIQKKLYQNHFYIPFMFSDEHPAMPPVADIMYQNSKGLISNTTRDSILGSWGKHDNRDEQKELFYRYGLSTHHYLQLNGGNNAFAFSASGGYDLTLPEVQGSKQERWMLDVKNSVQPFKNVELQGAVVYMVNRDHNLDLPLMPPVYLPLKLKDGSNVAYDYERESHYLDTVVKNNNLLNWHYYPVDEFNQRDNTTFLRNLRVSAGIRWKIFKGFDIQALYQYQQVGKDIRELLDKNSYAVRGLVNKFSQLANGNVARIIPYNDILDEASSRSATHNVRSMVTYGQRIRKEDSLRLMAGYDAIMNNNVVSANRTYGYNVNTRTGQNDLNYRTSYPVLYSPTATAIIPRADQGFAKYVGFVSYYGNANYNHKGKYYFSGSLRVDKSNLYGDSTNGKTLWLYSCGVGWDMNAERFYRVRWLPMLKLRATYGIAGNSPMDVSSVTTIRYDGTNANGDPMAVINNPPLPFLRWEQIATLNFGLNFRVAKNILDGSVDWYYKNSTHLLANHEIDPTTGSNIAMGNVGSMRSNYLDVVLNSKNIDRKNFRWTTRFLFTWLQEKITGYTGALLPAWYYCDPTYFTVIPNRPPYAMYSFRYLGLDAANGDPIGFTSNDKNKNYNDIITKQGYAELVYHGRTTPGVFGSLSNEFVVKDFVFSFLILYKFNYYFRRKSINYNGVYFNYDLNADEYSNRWQHPGDELKTNVPSEPTDYLNEDKNRDLFYNFSEVNVERGDHIRLQTLYFGYNLNKAILQRTFLKSATIYASINNIGIIWRANHYGLDPDKLSGFPALRMYAFGVKFSLEKQS